MPPRRARSSSVCGAASCAFGFVPKRRTTTPVSAFHTINDESRLDETKQSLPGIHRTAVTPAECSRKSRTNSPVADFHIRIVVSFPQAMTCLPLGVRITRRSPKSAATI